MRITAHAGHHPSGTPDSGRDAAASTGSAIDVMPTRWNGAPALRVRVPVGAGESDDDSGDLRIRLLDRCSGVVRGLGLLSGLYRNRDAGANRSGHVYREAVIPVPDGVEAHEVRVVVD